MKNVFEVVWTKSGYQTRRGAHNSAALRVTNKFVPVAPTTVKVVSRYKSNFSATLKLVGALIERPKANAKQPQKILLPWRRREEQAPPLP